jgi:ABC-2 type transport system ATP-binding protein
VRAPRLLILDEPTNGLDPRGIREIRDLLVELNAAGTTVLLSSHLLSEVDQLGNRVGILDRGRLVLQEDLSALRAPTGRVLVHSPNLSQIESILDGRVVRRETDHVVVSSPNSGELNALLVREGVTVTEIAPERRTLEQIVLEVTSAGSDRVEATR